MLTEKPIFYCLYKIFMEVYLQTCAKLCGVLSVYCFVHV